MSSDKSASISASVAESTPGSAPNICHTCTEPITTPQFIRVGIYKFHKDHFTCCECHTSLHEKKFHHKESKFYCATDYVNKFCHTCRHCKQKIATGSVIQAFGGYYHPEHFVCKVCSKPFKNGKYYESNDEPYCDEHYFAATAEKCSSCGEGVKEAEMVRVQGKVYHSHCLSCCHCGLALAKKGSIFQKDGNVYCRADYLNFFCKRCTACSDHILKHCISVNDEFYHPECLQCSHCKKKLDKYICISGYLRCNEHTELGCDPVKCSICTKIVDGEVILSVGKKIHPECFKCSFCKTPLQKANAKLKDEKLCCHDCMMKKDPVVNARNAAAAKEARAAASAAENGTNGSSSSSSGSFSTASSSASAASSKPAIQSSSLSASLAASSASSNISGTTIITSPKVDESDQFTQYVKPQRVRKPSKQPVPQGKIEWKKGELIGKGSFGKVYMAMNSATGELIAVKQVRLNTAEEQEQAASIQNEIGLMENLRHPNIVSLLGTQRNGNKLNILMEYVPGKCWAKGTEMLLVDGTSKPVETLTCDDILLGDDSTPRKILPGSFVRGQAEMYEIQPANQLRMKWRCNADHILVLKCQEKPWIQLVQQFDSHEQHQQHQQQHHHTHHEHHQCEHSDHHQQQQSPPQQYWNVCSYTLTPGSETGSSLPQPMILSSFTSLSHAESYLTSLLATYEPLVFECTVRDYLTLDQQVKECLTMFQPEAVEFTQSAATSSSSPLTSSLHTRRQLLASILDTHVESYDLTRSACEISLDNSVDLDAFLFLARSIGMDVESISSSSSSPLSSSTSTLLRLTGDFSSLPLTSPVFSSSSSSKSSLPQSHLSHSFTLKSTGIDDYYGFRVSGNSRLLLSDFTVTHNSLDSLLEKFGGFSEKVIRSYTKQLLEALSYCHANRVVHRDIKGKNILIDTKGNLKLADFGSAKRFNNVISNVAPSLNYNYTPLWTAPEVLVGDYNSKVDIWSLGCVIIEMASAKPPWSEQNFENPFRALYHIGNSDAIPKIPESLSEVGLAFVKQCLRRNPDERPDAMTLLRQDWLSGIESLPNNDDSGSDGEDGGNGTDSD